jgi:2,4-dienoyl-CoA reductase-like NADH-dependent reductase (Old Yellow Enzyme family)
MMNSIIFEPLKIRNRSIPNRFFAEAMEGNDGEKGGLPSERTISRYSELARGCWGTVLIEAVSVSENSLARKNGLIIKKKNLDGIKRLVESFRKNNDTGCLLLQITHSGERSGPFSDITTLNPNSKSSRYLSTDEVEVIKDLFIAAALLAEEAGVDGIDFKMCHGYFGGEILRPSNIRNDKWGGSFENRTRLLREAIGEIRSRQRSPDFILGSRLSMYEGIRGGCGTSGPDEIIEDITEMLKVVMFMDSLGMDYVNVSAGIPALTGAITRPTEPSKYLALHQLRYAKTVKDLVKNEKLNLTVIGSAYSTYKAEAPGVMEDMISRGYVDLCGFGRQIFADPLMPRKITNGEKVNWCLLCSGCSKLMGAQLNDGCIMYNEYYKEVNRNFK